MQRTVKVILAFLALGTIGVAVIAIPSQDTLGSRSSVRASFTAPAPMPDPDPAGPELIPESLPIRRGDTLAELLMRTGIESNTRQEMIAAIKRIFDVRKLRAGSRLKLARSERGTLESLEYVIDPDRKLQLSHHRGTFRADVVAIPSTIRTVPVCGVMEGSLFESIARMGERPQLAVRIAEIFAWDLDFYLDSREGDSFCVLVEKKQYANGQPATYGRILAVEYNNAGTPYDAYLFPDPDGNPQYYSRDGESLQSPFLRTPLQFDARVSSHFSYRRLHPILKVYRPHLGTDYAAPIGAPVQAVAAGRVIFSGRSRGAGHMIKIRHAGGFETQYLHLSRRLVRRGQRVRQGQRIGRVGATGLVTGPHLDFRVRKNGRYVNFERLRFPRSSRLTAAQRAAFSAVRNRYLAMLQSGFASGAEIVASRTAKENSPATP